MRDVKLTSSGNEDATLVAIDAALAELTRRADALADKFAGATGMSALVARRSADKLGREQERLLVQRQELRAVSPITRYERDADALMADWDTLTHDQRHAIIEAALHRITIARVGRGKWPVETMRRRVSFG
jgi:hypothetical protein